ncbi:Peptidyl-Lys metalloendopeptidase [Hypsizygus marmoreus]|uniref:Peptidyl-Lys metalloendopeptidase n=1 Tax=Hypsizygus marmoreus TaxID=39966 RepID=A0A369KC71_HYPMA|nr:Peptidyl-Lys metalloendopeptidase [Hypsizygus marmoreus]
MFPTSVRSALAAIVISALAVSAAPGLSLKVAGPDAVTGVENLKVVATVTNTGDQTLKILNDPRSPLSKLPANTFDITDAKGARPAFTGIKVKYSPQAAAAASAYTVLAPGQSIDVEHNLSEAYNFTRTGAGEYSFEASNLFYVIDSSNKVVPIYADSEALSSKVSGNLAIARKTEASLSKRATFVGCSASRQTLLNSAASAAQSYAANSLSYINSHTSASTRYTTWFGAFTSSRRSTVQSHYSLISGNTFSSYTYDCTCTDSAYAYVYPDTFGRVYLCSAFWNAPATGTDSKAGTLIHESSHFTRNGGTDDYVYGQSAAKSLASSNPNNAVFNADNHEYFSENTPSLS